MGKGSAFFIRWSLLHTVDVYKVKAAPTTSSLSLYVLTYSGCPFLLFPCCCCCSLMFAYIYDPRRPKFVSKPLSQCWEIVHTRVCTYIYIYLYISLFLCVYLLVTYYISRLPLPLQKLNDMCKPSIWADYIKELNAAHHPTATRA